MVVSGWPSVAILHCVSMHREPGVFKGAGGFIPVHVCSDVNVGKWLMKTGLPIARAGLDLLFWILVLS